MLWILGMVAVVIATVVAASAAPTRQYRQLAPVVGVLVLIGGTLFASYNQIPAGHVGVLYQFGEIVGQTADGPQFIAPWRELRQVNVQVQRAEFLGVATGDRILGRVAAASQETQSVFFDVTLNWQVSPDAVQELYRNVGPDFFSRIVPTRVRQFFKAEIVKHTAIDATRKREEIRQNVATSLAEDLAKFSIAVVSLQIDSIEYEPEFEAAIEAKQVATQRALESEEVVKQKEAEARQAEAEAKGQAAAQIARAEGEKRARILGAEAEAEALVLEGDAKAQANRVIAASLTADLIQFEALKYLSDIDIALLPTGTNFLLDPSNILTRRPREE